MSADLNARALAALPPTLQAMVKAHPYAGDREDLAQNCWDQLIAAQPGTNLDAIFARARAVTRRYAPRGCAHDDERSDAGPQVKEGSRKQQRDAVAAVADRLRVGVRQARRRINTQKEKATGQGDFFGSSGFAGDAA